MAELNKKQNGSHEQRTHQDGEFHLISRGPSMSCTHNQSSTHNAPCVLSIIPQGAIRTRVGHASVTWATCNKLSHLITQPLTSSVMVVFALKGGRRGQGTGLIPEADNMQTLLRAHNIISLVCGCWYILVIIKFKMFQSGDTLPLVTYTAELKSSKSTICSLL